MSIFLSSDPVLSGTVSASAAASVNLSGVYNQYSILEVYFFDIVPSTNGANLSFLTSPNGTSFDSGGGAYAYALGFANNFGSSNFGNGGFSISASSITLATGLNGVAGQGTTSVKVTIFDPPNTGSYSNLMFDVNYVANSGSGGVARVNGTGTRTAAQSTQGVQLVMNSGNISCNYRVIGHP